MNIDDINMSLSKLQQTLTLIDQSYTESGDETLRQDRTTLLVVLSNMEKRRKNYYELARRSAGESL